MLRGYVAEERRRTTTPQCITLRPHLEAGARPEKRERPPGIFSAPIPTSPPPPPPPALSCDVRSTIQLHTARRLFEQSGSREERGRLTLRLSPGLSGSPLGNYVNVSCLPFLPPSAPSAPPSYAISKRIHLLTVPHTHRSNRAEKV